MLCLETQDHLGCFALDVGFGANKRIAGRLHPLDRFRKSKAEVILVVADKANGMPHPHNRLRVNDADAGLVGPVVYSVSKVYHQSCLVGIGICIAVNTYARSRCQLGQHIIIVQPHPVVSGRSVLRFVREGGAIALVLGITCVEGALSHHGHQQDVAHVWSSRPT